MGCVAPETRSLRLQFLGDEDDDEVEKELLARLGLFLPKELGLR